MSAYAFAFPVLTLFASPAPIKHHGAEGVTITLISGQSLGDRTKVFLGIVPRLDGERDIEYLNLDDSFPFEKIVTKSGSTSRAGSVEVVVVFPALEAMLVQMSGASIALRNVYLAVWWREINIALDWRLQKSVRLLLLFGLWGTLLEKASLWATDEPAWLLRDS
ncbi:hypothetical protein K488DRAFT_86773 [Vararia minispora EC-137]|uniref:Uncharacterized protein n=1 Tax=Vararia minispora EC-137 TaxID=1314806 RepID=A0ACB8QIP5_9AGAM|nr:hypothetical protein K488DRAFT_86773 [Vararia minispora EC-137]